MERNRCITLFTGTYGGVNDSDVFGPFGYSGSTLTRHDRQSHEQTKDPRKRPATPRKEYP